MARIHANLPVFCVVDQKEVPHGRLKYGAITCSKECATKREASVRNRQDETKCRYCKKPSTPEEREAFQRFRRLERKRPDLLYPEEFEAFKAERVTQHVETADPTPSDFASYRAKKQEGLDTNSVDEMGAQGNILAASTP